MSGLGVRVVDVVTPLRDWLRAQSTSLDARFYAGKLPDHPTFPAARIGRVGGGVESPTLDRPLVQIDVEDAANGSGSTVANIAAEIVSLVESAQPRTQLATGLLLMGATCLSNVDNYDPTTGAPRRSITFDLTTLATQ